MSRELAPVALVLLGTSLAACAANAPPSAAEPQTSAEAAGASEGEAAEPEAETGAQPSETAQPAQGASAPAAAAGEPAEQRTMDVIQAVVLEHRPKVRKCYDEALKAKPALEGDLVLSFVIDPKGKVRKAELNKERSTLTEPQVVACAIEVVQKIEFPPSTLGMDSKVNYPFNLTPPKPKKP